MINQRMEGAMKKVINIIIIGVVIILSGYGYAEANAKGKCGSCHSMHNSHDGAAGVEEGEEGASIMLNGSTCWDCHAKGNAHNIDPTTGTPQVMHNGGTDLAGGNFAYITGDKKGVSGDAMSRGHNINYTGVEDVGYGTYPPGDKHGNASAGLNEKTFTCAGTFGCHGDRTVDDQYAAVRNAHHYDDSALAFGSIDMNEQALQDGEVSDKVGSSYRFLMGVKGGEDADWQATSGPEDHNEYFGSSNMGISSRNEPAGNTISGLCAECHGNFHGAGATQGSAMSLWKRHPTDISMPGSGTEYAGYTVYDPDVPVARTIIPQYPSGEVNPDESTDDIVICLSCHTAHASRYENMLRFDYYDMMAGDPSKSGGCFVCHTEKNG